MSDRRPHDLSGRAAELLPGCIEAGREELVALPHRDRVLFEVRLERWFQNLVDGLEPVYGERDDFGTFLAELVRALARGHRERPEPLKVLDLERDLSPDWFQRPNTVGYVAYADRFAGTLRGVIDRSDYLRELNVTYLHLMSVLWPRDGENDGGYAVRDYREVDPRLGDRDDLRAVCDALRAEGTSLCVDLVLNHCSDQHPWALRALAGDERYQRYFYLYPDRTVPDAFEATLPEVFPDLAPGNFRWLPDLGRWIWTTFHDYQWDLNWSNPAVFAEIVEVMLDLANLGVEVFRLDAVAFLWKRMGTDCQNQPEVHDLLQALRACSKIATPAVAHKAEAIVGPDDLVHYFGVGRRYGKVANIAYHNSLMVQTWSALASRDTRLMTHALREFPRTPSSIAWATYLRCHDDIGWAVADDDAAAVGLHGAAHRAFLSDYYAGTFDGSHARGAVFGHNERTGDRRISGSLAALAGLQAAREADDGPGIELAIARILVGHAIILAFGGVPLLYMGDEIGLPNDDAWHEDPATRGDNRWMHRPRMPWDRVAARHDPATVEGRLFAGLRRLIRARRTTPQLHAANGAEVLDLGHARLFAFVRPSPLGDLAAVFNMTETPQTVADAFLSEAGIEDPVDRIGGDRPDLRAGSLRLAPYEALWLV